jgi:predicted DNA binding CopG/RHH family protein
MSVSASWIQLTEIPVGDRSKFYYFRRHELFPNIQWKDAKTDAAIPDIVDCLIAGAPYGGPLAMISGGKGGVDVTVKDDSNQEGVGYQQYINIYDAGGKPISAIRLSKNEALVVNMGWTNDLKLMVLTQIGRLHIFNVHGERFHHHSWAVPDKKSEKAKEEKQKGEQNIDQNANDSNVMATYIQASLQEKEIVINSRMFEEGCAFLTDSNRLFLVDDFVNFVDSPFQELKAPELATVSSTAMEILPKQYSATVRFINSQF